MNANQDIDRGKQAIVYFHNQALKYPDNYSMRLEQLIAYIDQKNPFLFEGMGFGILQTGIDDTKVKHTFEEIADSGEGRIPQNPMRFITALSDPAAHIEFLDAVKQVGSETAVDLAAGLQKGGQAVIDSSASILKYAPYILAGGVAIFALSYGRMLR